jgi:hypothetical protein
MIVLIKTLLHPLPVIIFLTACFFLVPATSFASTQDEINHLLNYIETSDCVFIRNNSRHTPDKAVAHIKRKYNYLKKRIKTTDDFIEGAATKSSMSGKPYMSICDGKEMATADWLRTELQRYRLNNADNSSLQEEKKSNERDIPDIPPEE